MNPLHHTAAALANVVLAAGLDPAAAHDKQWRQRAFAAMAEISAANSKAVTHGAPQHPVSACTVAALHAASRAQTANARAALRTLAALRADLVAADGADFATRADLDWLFTLMRHVAAMSMSTAPAARAA
jgi:hypothetical protein